MAQREDDPRAPLDVRIDTPGREGLAGTAPADLYGPLRDREQVTVAPDGRPPEEQPAWRQDFPVDWPVDQYVERRDFMKFMVLTSLAFTAGQFWIAVKSWIDERETSGDLVRLGSVPDLPIGTVSTGLQITIVPLRDAERLRRAVRDETLTREAVTRSKADCLYLFAVTDEGVAARMFDAEMGIGEDPATGGAAGPLGAYLAEHGLAGAPGPVTIRQGEQVGRPSELHVEATREGEAWRVRVGGGVHVVGRGEFDV